MNCAPTISAPKVGFFVIDAEFRLLSIPLGEMYEKVKTSPTAIWTYHNNQSRGGWNIAKEQVSESLKLLRRTLSILIADAPYL